MKIGKALDVAFKNKPENFQIFRHIADYRNYVDERLDLTPDDTILWQLEIEQLKRFLSDEEFMGWHEKNMFEEYLAENLLLYGDIKATLDDGLKLCEASAKTNNRIEFSL